MGSRHEVLTDRVNSEPSILRGCSSTELLLLVLGAIVAWFPLAVLVAWSFGTWFVIFGIVGAGVILTVWLGATWFQKVKRGRPDGYYQHRLVTFLHDRRLVRSRYIRRTGYWDVRRSE